MANNDSNRLDEHINHAPGEREYRYRN